MKEVKYFTTPIYYVNGNPHVGHAHTSVMGDILKRQFVMKGYHVLYTTGVDEHGQKNQNAIEESGLSAKEYLDKQSSVFSKLFDILNISYDKFVRTTDDFHKKAVVYILNLVYQKGLIVKKEYEGLYCVGCEMFKTKSDLDENGCCADHQTKPILMNESNYFFKLSVFQDWLIDFINKNPDWIKPERYRIEVLHLLEEPLPDLCISRPKERCWHGIELPFDKDFVAYVWFDALINYISSIGYPQIDDKFEKYWASCTHLMAKDIIKTHCIYWPIMLKAIGLEPQHSNFIHGYWTGANGIKMSKTIGNVVDPYRVIEMFGVDTFRYFLARTMGNNEASMSYDIIKNCYNVELANIISNGLYRIMKLAHKEYKGILPSVENFNSEDDAFLNMIVEKITCVISKEITLGRIFELANIVIDIGRAINSHFDKRSPWVTVKADDKSDFNSCIISCIEASRLLAETAYPIIPETAEKILNSFGIKDDWCKNYVVKAHSFIAGDSFEPPFILFQRME